MLFISLSQQILSSPSSLVELADARLTQGSCFYWPGKNTIIPTPQCT